MNIDHLDHFDIELSDIWRYELELIYQELKITKREKYTRDEYEHLFHLYENTCSICIQYGTSYLTKKPNDGVYLNFQNIYKNKKKLKDKIELGFFDFKGALYYLNQKVLIPNNDDSYDYWFALKLSQFDATLKYIDNFLEYHLKETFKNNLLEYANFLTLMIRQYKDLLLTKKVALTALEYVNFLSEELETNVSNHKDEKIKTTTSKNKNKNRSNISNSYTLIGSKSDPLFFNRNNPKFLDIFHKLLESEYIHTNTSYTQFKKVFSREVILPENRIHWIAKQVDLKAFIVTLCDQHKIEKPYSGIWKLTAACFIDKNKQDFNPRNLGNSIPSEDTKREFRKIVALFP